MSFLKSLVLLLSLSETAHTQDALRQQTQFVTSEDTAVKIATDNIVATIEPEIGFITYHAGIGYWQYRPFPNQFGEDRFTYRLLTTGEEIEAIVTILPVNDHPAIQSYELALAQDGVIEFDVPAFDREAADLNFRITALPRHGYIQTISSSPIRLLYRVRSQFTGKDSFRYQVNDGELTSYGEFTFEILPTKNQIIANDGLYEINRGDVVVDQFIVSEGPVDQFTYLVTAPPSNGTLEINQTNGQFSYQPNPQFLGIDRFSYKAVEGNDESNIASMTFKINDQNSPPTFPGDSNEEIKFRCRVEEPCSRKIEIQDPDGDKVFVEILTQPTNGDIIDWDRFNGEFVYFRSKQETPLEDDTFSIQLQDSFGQKSNPKTVRITPIQRQTLISDSFERETVFDPMTNAPWRFLVDDNGKGIEENPKECNNHICAKIFRQGDFKLGPMIDYKSGLFLFGREGYSTHLLYLISNNFNLINFDYIDLSFYYLPVDTGDNDGDPEQTTDEFLKVEVCLVGEWDCGLNPLDPDKLLSDRWFQVFRNDAKYDNNRLNGRNHMTSHWIKVVQRVSLQEILDKYPNGSKSNFVFRFTARLQDGFEDNRYSRKLEDAFVIDRVELEADGIEH